MKINNKLKKMCGNNLSKFLASNFNQEMIVTVIRNHFNNNGSDIKYVTENQYDILKKLLNTIIYPIILDEVKSNISATELLNSAGYTLTRTSTKKQSLKFKKYFEREEQLCKFNSNHTYKNTDVYFIIKQDANDILRLPNPDRQDKYSTSVMSTKISKDGNNVLQITSRYNHTVSGCDNTYNSNLDNIVDGLSNAFNYEFGYNIKKQKNEFEFNQFVRIDDVYVHYNYEINGVKIGDNTLVTDKIINYSKDKYYTYMYYLIDLSKCKIIWEESFFDSVKDGFVDYFNSVVEKIVFVDDINEVDDKGCDKICYLSKKR